MSLRRILRRALSLRWQLKAVIPVVIVLLLGLVAFQVVILSLGVPRGHWILIVAASIAVLLCGVLLTVLVILIEHPLHELKETIERIRQEDLSARVDFARRRDDIGQLGKEFNNMVQQLETNRAEIERLHGRELVRAEHLATLGELAAGLAHEIRNPLAGIAGAIDVIGQELPPNSSGRSVLPEVQNEIKHIQSILNDLLAYARPRPPSFCSADLRETVAQAVHLARQQIRTRPITIDLASSRDLVVVTHDPALIQQVVLNLLLNAIQAISAEGTVSVNLECRENFAVICIRDSGRGMTPDVLSKIFKPFFTTRGEGTGLGLSLAKSIVDAHGGRIEVTSQPGQGSTFCVLLPEGRGTSDHART
jgi:two-component system NtrC family sensor kinase